MTIPCSVVPHENPAKGSEPAKYYVQVQASGELDFEGLCETIVGRSTCAEMDIHTAISGILYEVKRALKAGRIARLGDLGGLQIGLNSGGAASAREFSGSMIKGAHLIFHPSKTLAGSMKILGHRQMLTRTVAQAGAGDGGREDPDKNSDSGGDGSSDEEAPDPTV